MGGHSMGATMTQMFAAYDFGDVAGYKLLQGMVLIEPTLDPLLATPLTDQAYLEGTQVLPGLEEIREEPDKYPPFFADGYGFGIVTAVLFQIYDLGVQIAELNPEGTQLYESGYMQSVVKYPATNAVCMAINMDNEFQFQPIARVSIGFLKIPPGKTLADVATRVRDDPTGVNPNGIWAPKDPGPGQVLQWDDVRDLSTISPELKGREVNHLENILKQKLPLTNTTGSDIGGGAVDTLEWYLPARLRLDIKKMVDLGQAPLSDAIIAAQKLHGGNPITMTKNFKVNIPALFVRAEHGGYIKNTAVFERYAISASIAKEKTVIATLDDYCHTDVLSSTEMTGTTLNRNSKKVQTNLPSLVVDFIQQNQKK
jgi:hypothetical protein